MRAATAITLMLVAAGCRREAPTFAHDVAPILFARCAPCHRVGGAAPFALTSYEEAARRATQIARVTGARIMPPWKALPGVAYANERRLDDGEIATLQRWARARAPLGDRAAIPPAPVFADGWLLGKPDLVVELPAYPLAAGGADDYRNFVVRAPVAATRWVAAWEFHDNGRAIHHAIVNLDRNGFARPRDGADGKPGYAGMEPGDVQSPDGFYLVWTPGQAPTPPAAGQAWRIDGQTDLVVQLHLQPTGKPESVHPSIALYFTAVPPTVARMTVRIGDLPIDLPPGARFTMRDATTLPVAAEVLALFPHLHYLGRTVRVTARLPDGSTRALLAIDDWDPAWQEKYVLAAPLPLPAGATLAMELGYDNSAANPRNPRLPPVRVQTGERTVDEMGNVTFELRLASDRDKVLLREAKYRRELERGGGALVHYNLGNTLAEQGRFADAIAAYRRAIALQPSLLPAHANLGRALQSSGDRDGAIREYQAALAIDPTNARV
ncbi:MAG: tetratricopeptide repeat protein, partial [Polyangia bacterium]